MRKLLWNVSKGAVGTISGSIAVISGSVLIVSIMAAILHHEWTKYDKKEERC